MANRDGIVARFIKFVKRLKSVHGIFKFSTPFARKYRGSGIVFSLYFFDKKLTNRFSCAKIRLFHISLRLLGGKEDERLQGIPEEEKH